MSIPCLVACKSVPERTDIKKKIWICSYIVSGPFVDVNNIFNILNNISQNENVQTELATPNLSVCGICLWLDWFFIADGDGWILFNDSINFDIELNLELIKTIIIIIMIKF